MAKKRAEQQIFEVRVTETRKPRRDHRIQISTEATLQQLHLALLAAFDYRPPYTTADRDFCFGCKGSTYTYGADGLKTLRELLGESATGTYASGVANLRAKFVVSSEAPKEKRAKYPLVYEAGDSTRHRLYSDNAQFGASYRYLKHEARQDSVAFRHGVYAGIIAGPPTPPSVHLKWIIPDEERDSLDELNALLGERMREHNAVADALLRDPDAYIADFRARFATRDDLLDWSFGFVFAMSLNMEEWQSMIAQNEVWAKSFEPIAMMLDFADDPARWSWLDDAMLQGNLAETVAMATVMTWQLWRDKLFPQPLRRTTPKVGANQPCPCGSGKKYKRCCGSSLRAV